MHYAAESYVFSKLFFTSVGWDNPLGNDPVTHLSMKLCLFNNMTLILTGDSFILFRVEAERFLDSGGKASWIVAVLY